MSETSYNGWPASKDQAVIDVKPFAVESTTLNYRAQTGLADKAEFPVAP